MNLKISENIQISGGDLNKIIKKQLLIRVRKEESI